MICHACERLRDIDRILQFERLNHHASYTELCRSAEQGCELCRAFRTFSDQTMPAFPWSIVAPEFDQSMNPEDTRISCVPHGRVGLFILEQKRLRNYREKQIGFNCWFELCADADSPLASIIPGRPVAQESSSEACFQTLLQWLQQCRSSHETCYLDSNSSLPSRVIDVGPGPDSYEPRLLVTAGQRGQWVALSHCWGSGSPITTTLNTLKLRQKSIPIAELPLTFRDAVAITKKLDFQYIWIDSLCIIQDSYEDWISESSKMAEVFSGASLVISASAAKDSTCGIFNSANRNRHLLMPLISVDCYSDVRDLHGSMGFRAQIGQYPMEYLDDEPLHRRAWALQETVLSCRRLDFSSSGVKWNCKTRTLTECYPGHDIGDDDLNIDVKAFHSIAQEKSPEDVDGPNISGMDYNIFSSPMLWWHSTLNNYLFRYITFHSDRLPAIAGIARHIAERTGYQYKAGLWLQDMHRGLLWQMTSKGIRPSPSYAPSWSWASVECKVSTQNRLILLAKTAYKSSAQATILEVNVVNVGNDPYSHVISASLKVRTHCRAVDWQATMTPYYNESHPSILLVNRWRANVPANEAAKPGQIVCTTDEGTGAAPYDQVTQEWKDQTSEDRHRDLISRQVIYMQIATFYFSTGSLNLIADGIGAVCALLLEPTGRNTDEYRRVGFAEIPVDLGTVGGWEERTVTII